MANTKSAAFAASSDQYLTRTDANLSSDFPGKSGTSNTGDFSMMFWMKRASTGGGTTYMQLAAKRDGSSTGFFSFYFDNNDKLVATYNNTGGTDDVIYMADNANTSTSWQHVAITVDVSASTIVIYINDSSISASYVRQNATALGLNNADFFIGNDWRVTEVPFDGLMDEIGIYNTFLSGATVSADYNSGDGADRSASETGIVGGWRFEDDFLDITSNNNDLTNNNSVTFSTDVPFVSSTAYTIIAALGTFTLTGIANILSRGYSLIAAQASFALTGIANNFLRGYNLIASLGTFTLTGIDAVLCTGCRLVANTGTFVLTGFDALFQRTYIMAASVGTFVLTGFAAITKRGYGLLASLGTFTLTGFDAVFTKAIKMIASVGSFTLTGFAATITKGISIIASTGVFTLTGSIASFLRNGTTTIWSNIVKAASSWTNDDRNIVVGSDEPVTSGASIVEADTSPFTEWENLNNLKIQDGNTTLAHAYAGGFGQLTAPALKVSGFTFDIPNNAKVVGIKLITRRQADFNGVNDYVADYAAFNPSSGIYLMKEDENITDNKGDTSKWATSFEDKEYGGESDDWGVTLLGADVNDSSFGVSYRPLIVRESEADNKAEIDYVSITVYYETWANDTKNTSTWTNEIKSDI